MPLTNRHGARHGYFHCMDDDLAGHNARRILELGSVMPILLRGGALALADEMARGQAGEATQSLDAMFRLCPSLEELTLGAHRDCARLNTDDQTLYHQLQLAEHYARQLWQKHHPNQGLRIHLDLRDPEAPHVNLLHQVTLAKS